MRHNLTNQASCTHIDVVEYKLNRRSIVEDSNQGHRPEILLGFFLQRFAISFDKVRDENSSTQFLLPSKFLLFVQWLVIPFHWAASSSSYSKPAENIRPFSSNIRLNSTKSHSHHSSSSVFLLQFLIIIRISYLRWWNPMNMRKTKRTRIT